ncbi:MAG: mannonate dehydratase [Pirellulaceae bacterium]
MRLASVVTPFTSENLSRVAQLGVTDIAIRYPGRTIDCFLAIKQRLAEFGLRIAAVEGELPIQNAILGTAQQQDSLALMEELLINMGQAGIPVCCYNWMPATDWARTSTTVRERGGAYTTAFKLSDVNQAASLHPVSAATGTVSMTAEQLWTHLGRFLEHLLPTAESAGVALAMHPDDPPLPSLNGHARIMNQVSDFQRLITLSPSTANGICFCQGTFAAMGVDIVRTIHELADRIRYVHFRDASGGPEDFTETFHDNGPTDMFAAIQAYHEIGYRGPIRPDHVPQLTGEEAGDPGYTMLARYFAFGYLRGLIQAAEATSACR